MSWINSSKTGKSLVNWNCSVETFASPLVCWPVSWRQVSKYVNTKMAAKIGTCCCNLPEEIWLHIVTYLDAVKDVLSLACTCKRLSELTNENIIWRRRFKVDNSQLLSLPSMSYIVKSNSDTRENLDEESGIWKKLYFKASHALSFEHRQCPRVLNGLAGERLCAEFRVVPNSSAARANNIRFDDRAPVKQSVEIWVKLNGKKPDGVIIGCQSESARCVQRFIFDGMQEESPKFSL